MTPTKTKTATKIRTWLKNKGHPTGKVNDMKMTSNEEIRKSLFELHDIKQTFYWLFYKNNQKKQEKKNVYD